MTKKVTFPPSAWDRDHDVVTGRDTPRPSRPLSSPEPPAQMMSEAEARAILQEVFAGAGFTMQVNYGFNVAGIIAKLDAYDPSRRVGYEFISHHDEDVVTDISEVEELAFADLAAAGRAHVLVVHDRDVPTPDALRARAEEFLAALRRR